MVFGVSAALLDTLVLRIVEQRDSYGYEISQILREKMGIPESTLYPVLRRLMRSGCLETYDVAISGRNRRYYRLTEQGRSQLHLYVEAWQEYRTQIDDILLEGDRI